MLTKWRLCSWNNQSDFRMIHYTKLFLWVLVSTFYGISCPFLRFQNNFAPLSFYPVAFGYEFIPLHCLLAFENHSEIWWKGCNLMCLTGYPYDFRTTLRGSTYQSIPSFVDELHLQPPYPQLNWIPGYPVIGRTHPEFTWRSFQKL